MNAPAPVVRDPVLHSADVARLLRDGWITAGWRQVERVERADPATSRATWRVVLADEVHRARAGLVPLRRWEAVPERTHRATTNNANTVRMRRVLDAVLPGDRVLDIGVNYGYLSGLLMRDGGVAAYTGIDLSAHLLESVAQMRRENRLEQVPCRLAVQDLYDLTPAWVAEHDPDLVVLLEVLEHVPDAERALRTVARCLRPDAAILFSVPVLGRLETCWGHVSLFDAARVRRMLADASLTAQHVEVVHDTWILVLASRTDAVLPRTVVLASRTPAPDPFPATGVGPFVPVKLGGGRVSDVSEGVSRVQVTKDDDGLHCLATGSGRRGPQRAGVTVPVPGGTAGLRLELATGTPDSIADVTVALLDRRGRRVCRWARTCTADAPMERVPTTVVLRPGRDSGDFRAKGQVSMERADAMEVTVEVVPGTRASFTVRRAATVVPEGVLR